MVKPYSDKQIKDKFIRIFEENVDNDELIWHRDRKDREVKVIKGKNWKLQYDDELPFVMKENEVYFIKAYQYHRIIKGNDNLVLEILEK